MTPVHDAPPAHDSVAPISRTIRVTGKLPRADEEAFAGQLSANAADGSH